MLSRNRVLHYSCWNCSKRFTHIIFSIPNTLFKISEITSPGYPESYENGKLCRFSVKSEEGSHIAVNFMDIDLAEPNFDMNCETEHLLVQDGEDLPSSFIGRSGKKFCGKRLPNYPGPSVVLSASDELDFEFWSGIGLHRRGKGFKVQIAILILIHNSTFSLWERCLYPL